MGYHLSIVRTAGRETRPITLDEFRTAAKGVPGLSIQEDGLSAALRHGGELVATLKWHDGEIWTKSSEDQILTVMLELAKRLNGRVRGDEMETYRSVAESYQHPDDAPLVAERQTSADEIKRKKRWGNIFRIGLLLLAIALTVWNKVRQ